MILESGCLEFDVILHHGSNPYLKCEAFPLILEMALSRFPTLHLRTLALEKTVTTQTTAQPFHNAAFTEVLRKSVATIVNW